MRWIVGIICVVFLLVFIGLAMAYIRPLAGLIILVLWFLLSIKFIGPDEMAVLVIFGIPWKFQDSGPHFVPFLPFCYLAKYPKKMYNFDYRAREVVTQAGKYKGTYYGSQVLKADSVAYLNFPREKRSKATGDDLENLELDTKGIEKTHPLIKILRAQVPIEDEKLKDWTEEAVLGALRVAFGKMTWRQAVDDIKKVTQEAENVFKAADGALIRAGFSRKGIQLVIAEITLPEKLQQAMPEVDRQRLEAEAAPYEAEQRAVETGGAIIKTFCNLTGIAQGKVEKMLQENPEEFVKKYKDSWERSWDVIHRRMGIDGGAYLDIRTIAGEPGKTLLDLAALLKRIPMGGKTPSEKEGREETEEEKDRRLERLLEKRRRREGR